MENELKEGDTLLTCSDCGSEFIFTAGEADFFQQKGLSTPKRCKPCRQKRKEEKARNA